MMLRKPTNPTEWMLLLGALSFIPTLFFYLVGEEGTYIITSMEMWHQHNWMQQLMYGIDNGRPPLINWLTMPVAALLGWSHVVVAIRLVSVVATLAMVYGLYWLARSLTGDRAYALFAALSSMALADWLLYRGWLSYTDPVFAAFTFFAIVSLWLGALQQRRRLLLLSVMLVSAALLTKAFTAYVFYASAGFILLLQDATARRFLLSPRSLLIFSLALLTPYLWFASIPHADNSAGMLDEIVRKLSANDLGGYLRRLITFPMETLVRLSPAALLAIYLLLRKRVIQTEPNAMHFRTAFWITFLCFLPYWLAPQGGIRYLLPIYPLVALIASRTIWRAGDAARTLALRWFAGLIAFKFLFALVLFPAYQHQYRGENYATAAQALILRTHGQPLYIDDVRSIGISIAGYIDLNRFPQTPLTFPPAQLDSGFLLSAEAAVAGYRQMEQHQLAADTIFLHCRGAACDSPH